ncbi:MAG: MMPL family transporter [Bacteroidia bacterium]|nr:MMPL family transporter [Bacteroidia bacterium]
MFTWLARIILRNRLLFIVLIGATTLFMGYKATTIQLSYDFARILPDNDEDFKAYESFKGRFGEDGSVMVLGVEDKNFYTLKKFGDWYRLGDEIKSMDGIEEVVSLARLYNVIKNDSARKFEMKPIVAHAPTSQAEVDSIKTEIEKLPFYDGFIRNSQTGATVMAITFDKSKLNTKNRISVVKQIKEKAEAFGLSNKLDVHISGLPYIRTAITSKVVEEMKLFMLLAVLVTAIVLFVFFRNFQVLFFTLIVVFVSVIWSIGIIAVLGYKITILSGLIPPLIIVIGIPNAILLLNKYQVEYSRHNSQAKALARMVQRIGLTTFLANVTTSIGFFVFYFTNSRILMEFGLVAAINVMATWLISLILIPIVYSYLAPPDVKHLKHLQAPRLNKLLASVDRWVHLHPKYIYACVSVIMLISFYGISKISTNGFVVDDLPKKDPVYVDMKFFESNFKGVLPLEFSINTLEPGGALKQTTLQKINRLQKMLNQYPIFSKPLSVVDGIKFSYQAYHDNDPRFHILPGTIQLAEMSSFAGDMNGKGNAFKSFIDSNRQITRVSVQMADIGSLKMEKLLSELRPRVDSIFPTDKYETIITGNSLIFLKGNNYMFKNLMESILLAIVLISIIMVTLFMSIRMILISIVPSLIPLVITAGLMGFFNISLKPSTILIFSIAFGMASDQTIYFLTKYRHEMRTNPVMSISNAVTLTIRETGVSMVYSSVILFFGFFIFSASDFGGTASLGKLLSVTLLVAMVANIIVLPAFLLSLERRLTTKAFLAEPFFETNDEEEDIDRESLSIRKEQQEDDLNK